MNEKIKKHLVAYNEKNKWAINDETIRETLEECGKELFREKLGGRRWWNDIFIVKDIDGMLIGYNWAETTGDMSPREAGWEFDDAEIWEVKPIEKTIIVYEKC